MNAESGRYDRAIALFDAANAQDPNLQTVEGEQHPKELLYARRMSEMLGRYAPAASAAVRLAVRAQHIQRWKIPRSDYPPTPVGYKQWRTALYKFHAETAGKLMQQTGCGDELIERVKSIVSKQGIKADPETQMLEDVVDLVFLEHYLADFAAKHPEYDEAKWIDILQKTWKKMSPAGREAALAKIKLPEHLLPLIKKAVGAAA